MLLLLHIQPNFVFYKVDHLIDLLFLIETCFGFFPDLNLLQRFILHVGGEQKRSIDIITF